MKEIKDLKKEKLIEIINSLMGEILLMKIQMESIDDYLDELAEKTLDKPTLKIVHDYVIDTFGGILGYDIEKVKKNYEHLLNSEVDNET